MSLLKRRHRKSKRNPNPYANRGLEKFARLSAELAEKRQQLSLQLGAPVSVVRFTLGSHSKWIPVIVSPTKKKAIETNSPSLMICDRNSSTERDSLVVAAAAPSPSNSAAMLLEAGTNGRDRSLSNARNDGEALPEVITRTASIFGTVAIKLLATKFCATFVMTIATALASSVLLKKWRTETAMATKRTSSEIPAAEERGVENSVSIVAAGVPGSKRSAKNATSMAYGSNTPSSPHTIENHLPLPRPVKTAKASSGDSSPGASEADNLRSSPTKQRRRLKCKFLREGLHHRPETVSEPSTPSESNAHIGGTSSEESSEKPELARWSSLVRERQRKEKAARIGTCLTAAGLLIMLGGLFLGQFTAIVALTWWWYVLPSLRKAVGDKPVVRSHNHNSIEKHHSNFIPITATKTSSKKTMTEVGSGKGDLQNGEYKRKVVPPDYYHRFPVQSPRQGFHESASP